MADLPAELLCNCLHDPEKTQINALDDKVVDAIGRRHDLSEARLSEIKAAMKKNLFSTKEVREVVERLCPRSEKLFLLWDSTLLSRTTLTSVGIAIGHANHVRRTNAEINLSNWITQSDSADLNPMMEGL